MQIPAFSPLRLCLAAALLGCGSMLTFPSSARAQDTVVLTDLFAFDGIDGSGPGSFVQGDDGNLYGVTGSGGVGYTAGQAGSGNGTVFRITPAGKLTTIYAFAGAGDGAHPFDLIKGFDGAFYGQTNDTSTGHGTVFRITPAGALTTIYASDSLGTLGPLVQDDSGNFYGVSNNGGPETANYGSLFRLTQAGVYTVLHVFTGDDGSASSALTRGSDGNFYGTSVVGGPDDGGVIYRLTPAGNYSVLTTFPNDADGFIINALTLAGDGNLYGTTEVGGAHGYGVIFRVTNAGDYTIIYNFTGGGDSGYPVGALVAATDGDLYGVAAGDTQVRATTGPIIIGGPPTIPEPNPPLYPNPPSTVFRVTLDGTLTTLYACNTTVGEFIQGGDGNFYNTAQNILTPDNGAIEKLTVVPHPAFFAGQAPLPNNVEYLAFANGNLFGYYAFLSDPHYLYHLDLGYEYLFDAQDGSNGLYLYDFASSDFFYTNTATFPYLYDFGLQATLYYYPSNVAGHYSANPRYFYNFATGQFITK